MIFWKFQPLLTDQWKGKLFQSISKLLFYTHIKQTYIRLHIIPCHDRYVNKRGFPLTYNTLDKLFNTKHKHTLISHTSLWDRLSKRQVHDSSNLAQGCWQSKISQKSKMLILLLHIIGSCPSTSSSKCFHRSINTAALTNTNQSRIPTNLIIVKPRGRTSQQATCS